MAYATLLSGAINFVGSRQSRNPSNHERELTRIAANEDRRAEELYTSFKQLYQPRERQILNTVFDDARTPAAEAARAGAEARASITNAESIALRGMRRAGINPGSPAYASIARRQQAADAGLEAAARTTGRRYAMETNLNNQLSAVSMGRNLVNTSSAMSTNAARLYGVGGELAAAREYGSGALQGEAIAQLVGGASELYKARKPRTMTPEAGNWGSL